MVEIYNWMLLLRKKSLIFLFFLFIYRLHSSEGKSDSFISLLARPLDDFHQVDHNACLFSSCSHLSPCWSELLDNFIFLSLWRFLIGCFCFLGHPLTTSSPALYDPCLPLSGTLGSCPSFCSALTLPYFGYALATVFPKWIFPLL